jgi:enterobactin synthetase component F
VASTHHLYAAFARQAYSRPDSVALRFGQHSVRYSELDVAVNRAAAGLAGRDLPRGFTAVLHLERSVEWVVAVLAVHARGGTVVPLPPSYPAMRRQSVLDFVAPDIVIDAGLAPAGPLPTWNPVNLGSLLAGGSQTVPKAELDPDQAAFVLASSGSTGRPKMIVRSHRSFFHRLEWTWAGHPFGEGEVGCHKAPLTTTHGVYELFEPLLAGATTVVLPDEETRNLETFWRRIRTEGVSRLLLVPSALQASLDMPGFEFPELQVVVLMGEYLATGLAEEAVLRLPPRTAVYSVYGSTEASSALVCDLRESLRPGEELPLGHPISDDVRAVVLDPTGVPIRPGGEGRLHIGGTNLFSGYLSDAEATRAALVSPAGSNGVVYDTRDKVRVTLDGALHFLGRTDHTVKVRGFRVALSEVERALMAHPKVAQAVVVFSHDGSAQRLMGFYSPSTVGTDDLFRWLRDRLLDYMVPSALVGLDSFPLSARGKVDRSQLAASMPHRAAPEGTTERTAVGAETPTEIRISEVWAGVLGHTDFTVHQSFFEVGGSSLTVFSMVHRLRVVLGVDPARLKEETVWRFPSVRALARYLARAPEAGDRGEGQDPILLTLRTAKDATLEPLFAISSAGGTVGAYEKLSQAVKTGRAVVGLQDPFLWGARPVGEGFDDWISRYLKAIRAHQPNGPYHIVAFSSAGAFGLEISRRLRSMGERVALLTLVDPIAMDRDSTWRFGRWALQAIWMRAPVRWAVRRVGRLRAPLSSLRRFAPDPAPTELTPEEIRAMADAAREDKGHLLSLSALMELNTGLPFALSEADFEGLAPDRYLAVFLNRARSIAPGVAVDRLERMVSQYPLQVRAQHLYRMRPYDGPVLLVEPLSPHAGLVAAHLRPWISDLRVRRFEVGPVPSRLEGAAMRHGALDPHYRSMRDDRFISLLAEELDMALGPETSEGPCPDAAGGI